MRSLWHLLFIAGILFTLAGHSITMGTGPQAPFAAAHAHPEILPHAVEPECHDGQICLHPGHADACCAVGQCLAGIVAPGIVPPAAPAAQAPEAAPCAADLAAPHESLERPPKSALS